MTRAGRFLRVLSLARAAPGRAECDVQERIRKLPYYAKWLSESWIIWMSSRNLGVL